MRLLKDRTEVKADKFKVFNILTGIYNKPI